MSFHENWYSTEQLAVLQKTYGQLDPTLKGLVVEIGVWEGRSASILARACYPENLVCVDTWAGNVEESRVTGVLHPTVSLSALRDVFKVFVENMSVLTQGNYVTVKQDCNIWLDGLTEPVKFAHVDASHDYPSVHTTITKLLPHLVVGGILCGDDFESAHAGRADLQGGVERAVRELLPGFQSKGNFWWWQKRH